MASTLFLFVPAHDDRKVAKAVASPCDAVILDLEASVPPDRKAEARQAAAECLAREVATPGPERWVRVHGTMGVAQADIAAIDWTKADGAVVSHATDVAVLQALRDSGATRLLPMIESAAGLAAMPALGCVAGVERFAIGTWDLALDLRLFAIEDPDDSDLIWSVRGALVVASRQLGLAAPIDGVYARVDDDHALRRSCERARRLGFGGKLLIHPRQIDVARDAFAPRTEELEWATAVVEGYERAMAQGRGAIRLRGRLIDLPIYERAKALLRAVEGE